jgi:glycerate kinase
MLTMAPTSVEVSGPAPGPQTAAKLAMQQSGAIRPALPRLRTLKTFNLPPEQVEEVLLSAASMLPTPTSEILDHPLRILVAPSGFKESLGPEQVADAIDAGVRRVLDDRSVIVRKLPLHDGGEGFARALVAAHGGEILEKQVIGPIGDPVSSHLGFLGNDRKTAVLDMAAAAGLRLVPKSARDPTVTTTYGVGQIMKEALDAGSNKIIIGCGDSGTSDGGAGMLQALGVRLLDANGDELPRAAGGRSLLRLDKIDWDGIHPRLGKDAGKLKFLRKMRSQLTIVQSRRSRSKPSVISRMYCAATGA